MSNSHLKIGKRCFQECEFLELRVFSILKLQLLNKACRFKVTFRSVSLSRSFFCAVLQCNNTEDKTIDKETVILQLQTIISFHTSMNKRYFFTSPRTATQRRYNSSGTGNRMFLQICILFCEILHKQ